MSSQEVSPKLPGLEKVYEALEAVVKENAAKEARLREEIERLKKLNNNNNNAVATNVDGTKVAIARFDDGEEVVLSKAPNGDWVCAAEPIKIKNYATERMELTWGSGVGQTVKLGSSYKDPLYRYVEQHHKTTTMVDARRIMLKEMKEKFAARRVEIEPDTDSSEE